MAPAKPAYYTHVRVNTRVCRLQEYLRRKGYVSAMRALETESKAQAEDFGEDAAFFRALVLDGRWDDAITLIEVKYDEHFEVQ